MFSASLFSVLDGTFVHVCGFLTWAVAVLVPAALCSLGWAVKWLCVVLGLLSLEVFLPALRRLIAQP